MDTINKDASSRIKIGPSRNCEKYVLMVIYEHSRYLLFKQPGSSSLSPSVSFFRDQILCFALDSDAPMQSHDLIIAIYFPLIPSDVV